MFTKLVQIVKPNKTRNNPIVVFTKLVQIVKPYKTRSNLKVVFTKLVQIVKPYKTKSNLKVVFPTAPGFVWLLTVILQSRLYARICISDFKIEAILIFQKGFH